ncbi:MAG: heavy-metal-associated domain-containing protein [Dysgonamonadaceae bacterium]
MKKIILLMMVIGGFIFTACNAGSSNKQQADKQQTEIQNMEMDHSSMTDSAMNAAEGEHAMLNVDGLCEMCKQRIETATKNVKGVTVADWNIEKKVLHVNFDPNLTNIDAISKAIADGGYDTDKYEAPQAAYDALPSCCKYRD